MHLELYCTIMDSLPVTVTTNDTVLLHYHMKYLCSKICHTPEVIEANFYVNLSQSKRLVYNIYWQNIHYSIH